MATGRKAGRKPKLTLILDPRFPGGTCSAVAHEIAVVCRDFDLKISAIETRMFKGRSVNSTLQSAADENNIAIVWDQPVISADIVAFHNPSCLKFNDTLDIKIICGQAYVVTHENFLRPNDTPGFDIEKCLNLISKSLVCPKIWLAPVSQYNRQGVTRWIKQSGSAWRIAPYDWFNICDFKQLPPVAKPSDRRGRVSRPGFEKYPPLSTMIRHFPAHAQSCRILGGDTFILDAENTPSHWEVHKFRSMPVDKFLEDTDFFVYYTHPNWRESFGRVIAEAIAAGKVVITDPGTAATFGCSVVASDGSDVDAIIDNFVQHPAKYRQFVSRAQKNLIKFGSDAFRKQLKVQLSASEETSSAFL